MPPHDIYSACKSLFYRTIHNAGRIYSFFQLIALKFAEAHLNRLRLWQHGPEGSLLDHASPGEEPPIGLILCGEKNREQIELLKLDQGEISVAE